MNNGEPCISTKNNRKSTRQDKCQHAAHVWCRSSQFCNSDDESSHARGAAYSKKFLTFQHEHATIEVAVFV